MYLAMSGVPSHVTEHSSSSMEEAQYLHVIEMGSATGVTTLLELTVFGHFECFQMTRLVTSP